MSRSNKGSYFGFFKNCFYFLSWGKLRFLSIVFFFPEAMFVFSDAAIYLTIPFLTKDVFKEKKALAVKTFF